MIGRTVSHYRILEELGSGGMGVVYRAEDTRLGRIAALKFLPRELVGDAEAKERLVREARAASALDHPNICTVYEIGETEDGQLFIAMAYYEGATLQQTIESGPMTVERAVDVIRQVAEGLGRAHRSGIVHRDVKPANVIVTREGIAKILDFGLAKIARDRGLESGAETAKRTAAGVVLGTLAYMSPEQLRGKEIDRRTDIWSLGIVLYEMLSGRRPFDGIGPEAFVHAVLHVDVDASRLPDYVPAPLKRVIERATARRLDDRYDGVDALLDDVRSAGESPKTEPARSIAVLPFVNTSADPENEYFSDGLAEDLIHALSKIEEFRVAARTSAFSFKGEKVDVRTIGQRLRVSTVLEGSVRKAGHRLRITTQLVDVQSGYHLWAEQYDRVMEDVFEIQDEITAAIVNALKVELLAPRVVRRHTEHVEAYQLYLKGRYHWNKRTLTGFRSAIDEFQKAIVLDPAYALAYVGVADSYALLGDAGHSAVPPREAFAKARPAVEKALEMDDSLAEAHASLGHIRMHEFDWDGARTAFDRAIELDPTYATTYHWYSSYLVARERHEEAVEAIRRALAVDPVSLAINTDLGVLYYYARRYDDAIAQYRKVLQMEPGFIRAHVTLGSAHALLGRFEEAVASFEKAMELLKDRVRISALGRAYALAGERAKAFQIIDELLALSKERYVSPYAIALIYAGLGEVDRGLEWLEKAYDERVGELIFLRVDPYLDNLRGDAKFHALLRKVGLGE